MPVWKFVGSFMSRWSIVPSGNNEMGCRECQIFISADAMLPARGSRWSAQQIFELNLCVGLGVAVLDNHGRVERYAPVLAHASWQRARTGNHYGFLRHDERFRIGRRIYLAAPHVVKRRRTLQNCARAEHGAPLHN